MGRPGMSTLWKNDAAAMSLWGSGEKEMEILCHLPSARVRLVCLPGYFSEQTADRVA